MTDAVRWHESLGASGELLAFAATFGDRAAFWAECPRGDWLLWLALRAHEGSGAHARSGILGAARAIAALGLEYLPDDDTGARSVLDALAEGRELPTEGEIDALEREADAAADAAPACPWCALLGIDAAALDAGGAGDRAGVMVPETSECDSVGLRAALPTVRVTRLCGAMSEDLVRGDLRLEANPDQSTVSRTFVVEEKPDGSVAISRASISPAQPSSLGVAGLLVALGAVLLRRLRQPQRPAK